MSKFGVNFIVDSKHFGEVMEVLQPFRVEDLAFKLVAGTPTKVRAGDVSSTELMIKLADNTPRPMKYFREGLLKAGFRPGTVYNTMTHALRQKMIVKKMVNGVPHYMRKA